MVNRTFLWSKRGAKKQYFQSSSRIFTNIYQIPVHARAQLLASRGRDQNPAYHTARLRRAGGTQSISSTFQLQSKQHPGLFLSFPTRPISTLLQWNSQSANDGSSGRLHLTQAGDDPSQAGVGSAHF